MRQLIYISTATPGAAVDPATILAVSRRRNRAGLVSGLLYYDGKRFLQALEGSEAAVAATFARIERDPRHRAIVALSDREVEAREFGDWAMAFREPASVSEPGKADDLPGLIAQLTRHASPEVRATFEGFAKIRRAA